MPDLRKRRNKIFLLFLSTDSSLSSELFKQNYGEAIRVITTRIVVCPEIETIFNVPPIR